MKPIAILSFALLFCACATTTATDAPQPASSTASPMSYEPTTLQKAVALSASDFKGKGISTKCFFNQIFQNPYWGDRFPANGWVQFWVSSDKEHPDDSTFQNVFVRKESAGPLFDLTKNTPISIQGVMDNNGTFPFLVLTSIARAE